MKRTVPFAALDISSDDDDDGDKPSPSNGTKNLSVSKRPKLEITPINPSKKVISQELLTRSAKMYQEYMREIPIPTQHRSIIPFSSWTGLAKSMKQLYQQPLHYLTNIRIKEWDQMRNGADDDDDAVAPPLDTIIHPCKAETTIWLMEQVHRLTSSHQHLAKLWVADPMYYSFIDSVFPQLGV